MIWFIYRTLIRCPILSHLRRFVNNYYLYVPPLWVYMSHMNSTNSNSEAFLSFTKNPSLSDATNDVQVGKDFKAECVFTVISRDSKGLACQISSCIPEGYEEDDSDGTSDVSTAPTPNAPGYLGPDVGLPVETAMRLKKKGSQ